MTAIETQIAGKEAQLLTINAQLPPIRNAINVLRGDLAAIVCRGNKQEKATCQGRKNRIESMIKEREDKLKELNDRIKVINTEILDLSRQRDSEGKAIVNLSNQGLTPAAVLANTTAQAEAAREVATAQAKSIETDSATKQVVIWGIVVVVAIIILVIIRKKLA